MTRVVCYKVMFHGIDCVVMADAKGSPREEPGVALKGGKGLRNALNA